MLDFRHEPTYTRKPGPLLGGYWDQPTEPLRRVPRRETASRASKRQLCVLAGISGILKLAHNRVSAPDLKKLIAKADKHTQRATEQWVVTGDEHQHLLFAADALTRWDAQITDDEITIAGSVALALHLLTDLEALVSRRENKQRVNGLFAPIQAAYDWLDERGTNWPAIEWAEDLAGRLYRIVGED